MNAAFLIPLLTAIILALGILWTLTRPQRSAGAESGESKSLENGERSAGGSAKIERKPGADFSKTQIDVNAFPRQFVVFDLETTGLDPARHEIIEFGAIRVDCETDLQETFQTLVKPRRAIPKTITRLTGISQDMVEVEGQTLEVALKEFSHFIRDLPLVSFNAEFDMAFLRNAARLHNVVVQDQASCALKLARRAWPGRNSYRLSDIARDANLPVDDAHRALGDCQRTLLVYTAARSVLGSSAARRK